MTDWRTDAISFDEFKEQIEKRPNMFLCHCGAPVHVHEDLDNFTRGLCRECDTVRCDAYPGECGK